MEGDLNNFVDMDSIPLFNSRLRLPVHFVDDQLYFFIVLVAQSASRTDSVLSVKTGHHYYYYYYNIVSKKITTPNLVRLVRQIVVCQKWLPVVSGRNKVLLGKTFFFILIARHCLQGMQTLLFMVKTGPQK